MKRFWLILLGLWLVFPASVSAHLVGQPPFFKINGVYSNLYPVPSSSIENFGLPQDLAPADFVVGQQLVMEFDENVMPAPKSVVKQTKFIWDFGDGAGATGLKNTHIFTKPGSYLVLINAQYLTDPSAQLIESVLVNIMPSAGYKIPQAVIKVNGQQSHDPLNDVLKLEFSKPLVFDGSDSLPGSAKIVSFSWDLGDTNTSNQAKFTHQYDNQLNQIFPVLRVKDENGLISDQYVQVQNSPDLTQNPAGFVGQNLQSKNLAKTDNQVVKVFVYLISLIIGLILAGFVIKYYRRLKKSRPVKPLK